MLGAEKLRTGFRLDRLKKHLSRGRMVLILNEINQPVPKEKNAVLYNLFDFRSVAVTCACNSQEPPCRLERHERSTWKRSGI